MIQPFMTHEQAMALGAHCHICPLFKEGTIVPPAPAFSSVETRRRLIVVGEGPGRNEEKVGRPFVGMSGGLLWGEIGKLGVRRETCHTTNAALCRGETDADNRRAAECCAPRLLRELQGLAAPPGDEASSASPGLASPVLLLLGAAATKMVLGQKSILKVRGFMWSVPSVDAKGAARALSKALASPEETRGRAAAILSAETRVARGALTGVRVLPTLHPAFVLRADTWAPVFRQDLKRATRWTQKELVREDHAAHSVGGLEVLKGLGPVVSLDIETAAPEGDAGPASLDAWVPDACSEKARRELATHVRLARLLCVGISDGVRTGVIWPWKAKYARPLSRWLRTRDAVVMHNGL